MERLVGRGSDGKHNLPLLHTTPTTVFFNRLDWQSRLEDPTHDEWKATVSDKGNSEVGWSCSDRHIQAWSQPIFGQPGCSQAPCRLKLDQVRQSQIPHMVGGLLIDRCWVGEH